MSKQLVGISLKYRDYSKLRPSSDLVYLTASFSILQFPQTFF